MFPRVSTTSGVAGIRLATVQRCTAEPLPDAVSLLVISEESVAATWLATPSCIDTSSGASGLIDVHELNYNEAAQVIGVPIGTIKSRVSRGRAMMRYTLSRLARVHGIDAKRIKLRFSPRPSQTVASISRR